mmetsp:Transcript_17624/g.50475  ORF Transcript_17624/g.50475 Transcript_17624/m.50475 type:complete len:226 (-) Transcript_17624:868-1545(-)
MTCSTPPMSSPRAATSVATRTRQVPARNFFSAASRWGCDRSPWMSSARTGANFSLGLASPGPPRRRQCLSHTAVRFFWTKTSVRPSHSARALVARRSFSRLSAVARTSLCSMFSTVDPTRPTAIHTYARRKAAASFCTSGAKVAENSRVWRRSLGGMSDCWTMRRIWGSKPMSSMRSPSSRTRKVTAAMETTPRSMKSLRRPGVATTMSHPKARSRTCFFWSAPP